MLSSWTMATEPQLWKHYVLKLSLVWDNVRFTQVTLKSQNNTKRYKGLIMTQTLLLVEWLNSQELRNSPHHLPSHYPSLGAGLVFPLGSFTLLRMNTMPETEEFSTRSTPRFDKSSKKSWGWWRIQAVRYYTQNIILGIIMGDAILQPLIQNLLSCWPQGKK